MGYRAWGLAQDGLEHMHDSVAEEGLVLADDHADLLIRLDRLDGYGIQDVGPTPGRGFGGSSTPWADRPIENLRPRP